MKRIICLTLCMVLVFGMTSAYAAGGVKVYAPDGRSETILASDVPAWKAVGWYTYPVIKVYAPDGRSHVIEKATVDSWTKVGWYTYPVVTVYSPSGSIEVIAKDALKDWQKVGWYTYPVIKVYAPDGRSAVIAQKDLKAWKNVGWSEKKTTPKFLSEDEAMAKLKAWIGDLGTWVAGEENYLVCDGLYTIGGKKYYQFRLHGWVFDHSTTLTFYVISADGTEKFDGMCSNGYLDRW